MHTFFVFLIIISLGFLPNSQARLPDDVDIRRYTAIDGKHVMHFSSHSRLKLLKVEGGSFLVGTKNALYNVSLSDMRENKVLKWNATSSDYEMCIMKGKSEHDCHNYILLFVHTNEDEVLVCGTNAGKPRCRRYLRTKCVSCKFTSLPSTMKLEFHPAPTKSARLSTPMVNCTRAP